MSKNSVFEVNPHNLLFKLDSFFEAQDSYSEKELKEFLFRYESCWDEIYNPLSKWYENLYNTIAAHIELPHQIEPAQRLIMNEFMEISHELPAFFTRMFACYLKNKFTTKENEDMLFSYIEFCETLPNEFASYVVVKLDYFISHKIMGKILTIIDSIIDKDNNKSVHVKSLISQSLNKTDILLNINKNLTVNIS